MAWAELNLTVARTLWFFDFEKALGEAGSLGETFHKSAKGGDPVPFLETFDNFPAQHDGPNLVFRVRAEVAEELNKL